MNASIVSPNITERDRIPRPISFVTFRKLNVICLVILLSITGCQTSFPAQTVATRPASYESLCQLPPDQFGNMTQLDVMQWIASKHGEVLEPVAADSISELDDSSVTRIVWKAPNQAKLANAFFLRDNKLIRLTLENIVDGPTFSDVVSNLGSPEWLYRSAMVYDKNVAYTIGLRYPRIGIDVYTTGEVSAGESFIQGQPILPFSSGMHVQKIECYKAGSIQQVMKENFFMSEETISITLQKQMPWPGFTQSHIPYNNP